MLISTTSTKVGTTANGQRIAKTSMAILSQIYALFGAPCTGLNSAMVPQKSGIHRNPDIRSTLKMTKRLLADMSVTMSNCVLTTAFLLRWLMTKEAMTWCLASILHVERDDDRQKRQPRVDTKQKKDMRDRWLALVLCFVVQAVQLYCTGGREL